MNFSYAEQRCQNHIKSDRNISNLRHSFTNLLTNLNCIQSLQWSIYKIFRISSIFKLEKFTHFQPGIVILLSSVMFSRTMHMYEHGNWRRKYIGALLRGPEGHSIARCLTDSCSNVFSNHVEQYVEVIEDKIESIRHQKSLFWSFTHLAWMPEATGFVICRSCLRVKFK